MTPTFSDARCALADRLAPDTLTMSILSGQWYCTAHSRFAVEPTTTAQAVGMPRDCVVCGCALPVAAGVPM
jgi:hypothetical protein